MKAIEEIRDWLLENAVNGNGNLYISDLDFSDFEGDVFINCMKVKGNLFQGGQEVRGNLYQNEQEVQGTISQSHHEVQGNLYQSYHKIQGNYTCKNVKVNGDINTNEPTKLLEEVTAEQLAEMGYKLKREN